MTSKTMTLHEAIAAMEAEAVVKEEERTETLWALQEEAFALEAQREEAEAALRHIRSRWSLRDFTSSPEDFAVAEATVSRASIALKGCSGEIDRVQQQARHLNKDAAEVVADIARAFLGGRVPVEATFLTPGEVKPLLKGVDLACIVHAEAGGATNKAGVVSGGVSVVYVRRAEHIAPLSGADLLLEAQRQNMSLQIVGGDVATGAAARGREFDRFRMLLHYGFHSTPKIPAAGTTLELSRLAARIAQEIATEIKFVDSSVQRSARDGIFTSSHVAVRPDGAKVEGETVDRDGLRTTAVIAQVAVRVLHSPSGSVASYIGRALEELEGQFVEGLGVVRSAKVVGHYDAEPVHQFDMPMDATVVATGLGGTGYEIGLVLTSTPRTPSAR